MHHYHYFITREIAQTLGGEFQKRKLIPSITGGEGEQRKKAIERRVYGDVDEIIFPKPRHWRCVSPPLRHVFVEKRLCNSYIPGGLVCVLPWVLYGNVIINIPINAFFMFSATQIERKRLTPNFQ